MKYIHVKSLSKYHPGYKDRTLQWAKIYFNMIQGDPDFELIENEIDKWRYIAMILLELKAKNPLPNIDRYWISKGFNLAIRGVDDTFKALSSFIVHVTEAEMLCYVDKDKEEDKDKDKEVDIKGLSKEYITYAEVFYDYNYKHFPKHLKEWVIKSKAKQMINEGADEIRKLIEIDKYSFEDVKKVLHWAVNDDFWKPNVIRLTGLRNKSKRNGNMKFTNIATKALVDDITNEEYTFECPDKCKGDKSVKSKLPNFFSTCSVCGTPRVQI